MPKRPTKKPATLKKIAKVAGAIVHKATAEVGAELGRFGALPSVLPRGHLGGKKGGPARAAKLSAKRRHEIAKKAAAARWAKKR